MNYVLVTSRDWNNDLKESLQNTLGGNWFLITNKEDLNKTSLDVIQPHKIFFPHWSYIIPEEIWRNFECIVFHMTDLPFGRGGSPLQNLIANGYKDTKISALKVEKGIDTGPIYLKHSLSLEGSANNIFVRAKKIITSMIIEIIQNNPIPVKQEGIITTFKRRTKDDGNIGSLTNIEKIHDYIRMLDAEGYPNAFIENEHFEFSFSNSKIIDSNEIIANVRIRKK